MVNSSEANAPSMPERTLPIPQDNKIGTLLENREIRIAFHQTVQCYKQIENCSSTRTFLQKCQYENITPPTFIIKLRLQRFEKKYEVKALNVLNQASKNLIKLSIENLKEEGEKEFTNHLNLLHKLLNLVKDKEMEYILLEKMSQMESAFRKNAKRKSQKKLRLLRKKEMNKKFLPNQNPNQNKEKGKEHETESDKIKESPSNKKHRRFVKKNHLGVELRARKSKLGFLFFPISIILFN
jgi:hypothetical protein